MAKVCANHLAQFGIGRYAGSLVSTKLKVTGIDLFSAGDFTGGDGTEEIVLSRSRRRRLQEAGAPRRQAGRRLPLRRHRRRRLVLQAAARRPQRRRHPRPADVRRDEHRRRGPPGPQSSVAAMADTRRSLRLQRRVQGHDLQGDQGQGPVHARRGAQAHQGQRLLRLVHRPGRADPDVHRRWRLLGRAEAEADVRLHRPQPPGGARRDPRPAPAHRSPRCCEFLELAHAERLRDLPPGAQLLPDLAPGRKEARDDPQSASSTSAATPTSRRTAPTR